MEEKKSSSSISNAKNSNCQRGKSRAINKANHANNNGTTAITSPTRTNLLRTIINNLSMAQGTNKAVSSQTATNNQNLSNNVLKNQRKINVDERKKGGEFSYAATATNSRNYESLNHVNRNNNQCANNKAPANNSNNNRMKNKPIGQAPRTLSILEALNELNLAVDENVEDDDEDAEEEIPIILNSPRQRCANNNSSNAINTTTPNVREMSSPKTTFSTTHSNNHYEFTHNCSIPSNASTSSPSRKSFNQTFNESSFNTKEDKNFTSSPKTITSSNGLALTSVSNKQKMPSWISKIFRSTKHGRLDLLNEALLGLDLTLIRHLVDARGNTLLHCSAQFGHVHILEWLRGILQDQFEAALNDQNANGRNVIITALKNGQLICLQWLIENTISGNKALTGKDGKKSLLHYAAKYNHIEGMRLLCELHVECQASLDVRDSTYFTPLHIAAKFGNINIAQVLIQFGADPSCQTELGCKPSDVSLKHHHMECFSYFRMAEAAAALGNDLHSTLAQHSSLQMRYGALRTHFREVLWVSKCLAKERNDLIKHFPFTGSNSSPEASAAPSLLLGGSGTGVRFSDLEHKLGQAELVWKQIESSQQQQHRTTDSCDHLRFPSDYADMNGQPNEKHSSMLQKYLAEAQTSLHRRRNASDSTLLDITSSSSDDDSSNCDKSSDDEVEGDEDLYEDEEEEPTYHNIIQCRKNANKNSHLPIASSNTPWLLRSTESSILSSMSQEKSNHFESPTPKLPNVNLLSNSLSSNKVGRFGTTTPRNDESATKKSSFSSSSSSSVGGVGAGNTPNLVMTSSALKKKSGDEVLGEPSSAAVIEVIEPSAAASRSSNKDTAEFHSKGKMAPLFTSSSSKVSSCRNSKSSLNIKRMSDGSCSTFSPNSIRETEPCKSLSCSIENEIQVYERNKKRIIEIELSNKDTASTCSPFDSNIYYDCDSNLNNSEKIYFTPDFIQGRHNGDDSAACSNENESWTNETKHQRNDDAQLNDLGLPLKFPVTVNAIDQSPGTQSTRPQINSPLADSGKCFRSKTRNVHQRASGSTSLHLSSSSTDSNEFQSKNLLRSPLTLAKSNLPESKHDDETILTIASMNTSGNKFPILPTRNSCHEKQITLDSLSSQFLVDGSSSQFICANAGKMQNNLEPYLPYSQISDSCNSPQLRLSWKTSDLVASNPMVSVRSLNGHQSPSPSETESAQAPPPSQLSSHSSELSKTESVQGHCIAFINLPAHGTQIDSIETDKRSLAHLSIQTNAGDSTQSHSVIMSRKNENLVDQFKDSCDQMRDDDKTDNNEWKERKDNRDDDNDNGGGCGQSSITQLVNPSTSSDSLPPHKSFQKNRQQQLIKATMRQAPKPWYEIEMSDDESEILLRTARARSRSSHSSGPDNYSNETENNLEPELVDGRFEKHECGSTTCSQFNCPNFV